MATFIGFSTVNRNKTFTLTDFDLIKQDLINAFNIQQGQLVGRPGYGTIIWSYIFENQLPETQAAIKDEIYRVVSGDPRLYIDNIYMFPEKNGMLIQLVLQVVSSTSAERLSIFFDQSTNTASYV